MKTPLYLLSTAFIFLLFSSCQKEVHFDFVSDGSLQKDANGNCQGAVNGSFITGKNLDANNYIQVVVHVTAQGSYTINSDTVNGYAFGAAGEFKDTGIVTVKLVAHGQPKSQGHDQFRVTYTTSSCEVSITVLDANSAASFTLQGAPGNCIIDTVTGKYVQGVSLDTSNNEKIEVNVSVPGSYQVSTGIVNGYSFSSSGIFSATGIQTISLHGSGTPLNTGTDVFTVTSGTSSCNFTISVSTIVQVGNNDYFPLTRDSHWNYDDLYFKGNTVVRTITDTLTQNGNLYRVMQQETISGPSMLYCRKSGSDYFEYAPADKYTGSMQYSKRIYTDFPFLKEGLATGQHWQSAEFSDTATFNQVIFLQYVYSCLDANAVVVINGRAFQNVYEIQMRPQIKAIVTLPYEDTGEVFTYYYAKGIGLIYFKEMNLAFDEGEWQLSAWQVN